MFDLCRLPLIHANCQKLCNSQEQFDFKGVCTAEYFLFYIGYWRKNIINACLLRFYLWHEIKYNKNITNLWSWMFWATNKFSFALQNMFIKTCKCSLEYLTSRPANTNTLIINFGGCIWQDAHNELCFHCHLCQTNSFLPYGSLIHINQLLPSEPF